MIRAALELALLLFAATTGMGAGAMALSWLAHALGFVLQCG